VIHRSAPPTDVLFKALGGGLLTAPPTTYTLPPVATFQRSGLSAPTPGSIIVLTTFGYQPGTTGAALDGWKALVAHAEEKEPGALAFDVIEDVKSNQVLTVQLFDGTDSADAHVNGDAIKANREQNGKLRTGERSIVRVKIVRGYLAK
jgi:quinol monooxygenase YgiN